MKWLFVSQNGESLGLAMHLSSEGHQVGFLVPEGVSVGVGLVDSTPQEGLADINVLEGSRLAQDADALRSSGVRVFGDSRWSNALDNSQEYGLELAQAIGWPLDGVLNGINLYTTVWFNGSTFISVYNSFVYRRFMSGGKGPDIEFAGALSNFSLPTTMLRDRILTPLARMLKRVNHRGCFHVHSLVAGSEYCVKELSASSNHPLALAAFENSRIPCTDVVLRAFNESSEPIAHLEPWTTTVMFSAPPYPYKDAELKASEIKGIEPANLKHLWLVDMKREAGMWQGAGLSGKLGYVTARGKFPSEAVGRAYRTLRNLSLPDMQYRDDIGRNVSTMIDTLRGTGWIN